MKRLLIFSLLVALLLGGCAFWPDPDPDPGLSVASSAPARAGRAPLVFEGVEIQRVAFRLGVSSATVERLAKTWACTGGMGAGLLTQPGPVEVYRMACDNGKAFLAMCDLRQCKTM